jgi:hypothetical protein
MKTKLFSLAIALAILLSFIAVPSAVVQAGSTTPFSPSQSTKAVVAAVTSSCGSGFYPGALSSAWLAKIRHGGAGGFRAKLNTEQLFTGGTVPWPNGGTMHLSLVYSSSTGYATMTVNGALPAYDPVVISAQVPDANGKLLITGKTSSEAVGIVSVNNVTLNGIPVSPCSGFIAQGSDGMRDVKYLIIDSVSQDFTLACDVTFGWGSSPCDEGPSLDINVETLSPPTPPPPTPPLPTPPSSPPAGSQTVSTSSGSSITADFGYIKVTFPVVNVPGTTWLGPANVDTSSGVAKTALSIVDIGSTASYEGLITITWAYDMSGLEKPEALKMYHFNGIEWDNITTSVDPTTNMVYGQVTSLSPFLLGLGGCFIATAAYGSSLDNHVDTLRSFRDQYLETNPIGSAFVSLYYKVSPPMANYIEKHPTFKPIVRVALLPAVAVSSVALNTTLAEKIAILIAMALFTAVLIMWLMRRTRRLERR